jgi:hypothetical protein
MPVQRSLADPASEAFGRNAAGHADLAAELRERRAARQLTIYEVSPPRR